jgi:hypothetical protein
MNRRVLGGAALAVLLFTQPPLNAQAPAPAVPAAPIVPPTTTPAPAAPNNLWSFLCPTPAQCAACKQKLCASPLAQFMGSALAPARALSGGLLPKCCPGPNDPNPADLAKPADSAEGAAARIKKEEANAKARRAAVRYLGTVDCKRFPEAEAALINALRADTNECVRLEAALALTRSCCCTRKVLEALVVTVSGRKTNDPPEKSERVKAVAAVALEHCLHCYTEVEPVKPLESGPPEPSKPEAGPAEVVPAPTQAKVRLTPDPLLEDARRALGVQRALQMVRLHQEKQPTPTLEPELLPGAEGDGPLHPVVQAAMAAPQIDQRSALVETASDGPSAPLTPPPTGHRDMWSVLKNAIQGK